ncbi:sugar ABC transporter permease [Actinocorallia sp. API 0066]|nr:sugar ABC transporter permease [Actinocorallia sp. API 0066]
MLLQLPVRGRSLYRAVLFLPAVVPPVAGALTFGALFDRDTGAVNVLLERFGVAGPGWTDGPRLPFVIGVLVLWGLGNLMMVSLAALADVPRDLFDAARVDGAGPLRTFTSVTLPLVSPVLLFQVVTGVIAGLQTYLPALVLGSAGAGGSLAALPEGGYFFMAHVYTRYAVAGRFGYASALLWALFVVTLLCAALMLRTTRRHVFTLTSPGGARP